MSCHGVNKVQVVEQPFDFLADVAAEFARRSRDLVDNRGATVEDCCDVFEVTTRMEVSPSSSTERLQTI